MKLICKHGLPPSIDCPACYSEALNNKIAELDEILGYITLSDYSFILGLARTLSVAREKYPGNKNRYVAFTGEAGESFYAMEKLIKGTGTYNELRDELIQTAAMACRLAVEGDADLIPCENPS
jgi:hypothetical protein